MKEKFAAHFEFPEYVMTCFKFNSTGNPLDHQCYVLTEKGKIFKDFTVGNVKTIQKMIQHDKKLSQLMPVTSYAIDRLNSRYFLFAGVSGVHFIY